MVVLVEAREASWQSRKSGIPVVVEVIDEVPHRNQSGPRMSDAPAPPSLPVQQPLPSWQSSPLSEGASFLTALLSNAISGSAEQLAASDIGWPSSATQLAAMGGSDALLDECLQLLRRDYPLVALYRLQRLETCLAKWGLPPLDTADTAPVLEVQDEMPPQACRHRRCRRYLQCCPYCVHWLPPPDRAPSSVPNFTSAPFSTPALTSSPQLAKLLDDSENWTLGHSLRSCQECWTQSIGPIVL
jgi:hypothetical protein